ncbi:MAG: hypothetical protein AM1032_000354 [Mycoplasmataceae bacterium]|nr:MAG: hypothetical protein AM1032_000354 [Mycoplasmataceae bacterium]
MNVYKNRINSVKVKNLTKENSKNFKTLLLNKKNRLISKKRIKNFMKDLLEKNSKEITKFFKYIRGEKDLEVLINSLDGIINGNNKLIKRLKNSTKDSDKKHLKLIILSLFKIDKTLDIISKKDSLSEDLKEKISNYLKRKIILSINVSGCTDDDRKEFQELVDKAENESKKGKFQETIDGSNDYIEKNKSEGKLTFKLDDFIVKVYKEYRMNLYLNSSTLTESEISEIVISKEINLCVKKIFFSPPYKCLEIFTYGDQIWINEKEDSSIECIVLNLNSFSIKESEVEELTTIELIENRV